MTRMLITAFEPYDRWQANASWLTLIEYARSLPTAPSVTTRLYPVNLPVLRERVAVDLEADYDVALHLGQAPGSASIRLEAIGLNLSRNGLVAGDDIQPLDPDGPVAYRSHLPLGSLAGKLRDAGIPAHVSYHAGTYLCNALLYLSHAIIHTRRLKTKATFIHLPLDPTQVATSGEEYPSLPAERSAEAVRIVVDQLHG